MAAHVTKTLGLSRVPEGCPLAAIYRSAPPIVHRALAGRARLDKGHGLRGAYPGGETAVDVLASDLLTRGMNARDRSDDAIREKERKQKEAADLAAQKGKR